VRDILLDEDATQSMISSVLMRSLLLDVSVFRKDSPGESGSP